MSTRHDRRFLFMAGGSLSVLPHNAVVPWLSVLFEKKTKRSHPGVIESARSRNSLAKPSLSSGLAEGPLDLTRPARPPLPAGH